MWAFRWLNVSLGIILQGQKCISSHQIYTGIKYCLSIHWIHRKKIFWYWKTWCGHFGGLMVVWGLYNIVRNVYWSIRHMQECNIVFPFTRYIGKKYSNTEWLNVSIPVTQWQSGDDITLLKVYIDPLDICRNGTLSFHSLDTLERNIHILNDLMRAFRWLIGGLGIILHCPPDKEWRMIAHWGETHCAFLPGRWVIFFKMHINFIDLVKVRYIMSGLSASGGMFVKTCSKHSARFLCI